MLSRDTPESALRRSWLSILLFRMALRWGKQVPLLLRAVPSSLRLLSCTSVLLAPLAPLKSESCALGIRLPDRVPIPSGPVGSIKAVLRCSSLTRPGIGFKPTKSGGEEKGAGEASRWLEGA
jgi:hypothetical protein